MLEYRRLTLATTLAAVLLFAASGVQGQVTGVSQIRGTVLDGFEDPIAGAIVSLWSFGEPTGISESTDRFGRFTLSGLAPGEYDLRVEILRFHPQVVRGVSVLPGRTGDITVQLREGTPPITTVDTTSAVVAGPAGQRWIGALEGAGPMDSPRLDEALTLIPQLDRFGGSHGLPNGMTTRIVQGVPYRTAAQGLRRQDSDAAISMGSVGLVRGDPFQPSRGFGMAGAGQLEVFNPVLAEGDTEVSVALSWDPLWSARYESPEEFRPYSYWASGRTVVDIVPDSARLVVGADFQHVERPRLPMLQAGAPAGLASPSLEDSEVVSAYALLDWNLGDGTRADLGFRAGTRPATGSPSPLAYPDLTSPREARDLVFGGGLITPINDDVGFAFRGGFTRSDRRGVEGWPLDETDPFIRDGSRARFSGVRPTAAGEAARSGIFASLALQYQFGDHGFQGGVEALRSTHELDPLAGSNFWIGSGDAFAADWLGAARRFENTLGLREFSVTNLGLFVRDSWDAAPGLQLQLGARWHQESLPEEALDVDPALAAATGAALPPGASTATGVGAHIGLQWQPAGLRGVSIHANGGIALDETDPWVLAEAVALDGTAQRRTVVQGAPGNPAWPNFPDAGTSAASLVLFPERWDLPTTYHGSVGFATRVRDVDVSVTGSFRRTESLTRRTDLNRIGTPAGTTDSGRDVFGQPLQIGRVVTTTPATSRRFSTFDEVWFLLQDGWSEYRGVTVSVERRRPGGLQLGAWYTLSSTEDNLPGLGVGRTDLNTASTVDEEWIEGTSDLDIPHRLGAVASLPIPVLLGGALRTRLRLESGRAFTPGLRSGVDLNGDGIFGNDPVLVPVDGIPDLPARFDCVNESRGRFMERNACRYAFRRSLDLGLSVGVVEVGGSTLSLEVDALNVLKAWDVIMDEALLVVDPSGGLVTDGTTVSPTLVPNGGLGGTIFNRGEGRLIRLGLRWGGDR